MDIIVFFGFLFASLFLAYFYFSKSVIYLGVLSAIIITFLGIILAATGNIESNYCFSNRVNQSLVGDDYQYDYERVCHTEELAISRDFINAMGGIMMFIGGGMVVNFAFDVNDRRRRRVT